MLPTHGSRSSPAKSFTWSEGPAWVADGAYLLFNDVPKNRMYRWSQADGLSVFLDPSGYAGPPLATMREGGANGLYAEAAGTVLLADSGNRLVARLDPAKKTRTTLAERFEGKRFNSPNDVVARRDGAVFFTDPPYGLTDGDDSPAKELKANGVYRIDTNGSVHLLDGVAEFAEWNRAVARWQHPVCGQLRSEAADLDGVHA